MTDIPIPTPRTALQSPTLRGAAAMAVAFAAQRLGVELPEGVAQSLADAALDLVFYAGLIAVGVGRARARAPIA